MASRILFYFAIIFVGAAEKVRYDNYALFKVHPTEPEHVDYLNKLSEKLDGIDFWKAPTKVGEYVSIVTSPEKRDEVQHLLRKRSIYSELMLENLQEAFDSQIYSRRKRSTNKQLYWTGYQTLEDIYEWFHYLAETHSDVVSIISAGQSYEGRNITGIKISRGSGNRAFVLQGGEIGADWISPVVVTYIVDQLVKGEDPEAKTATEDFEWHIFPVVNPDGFVYSEEKERAWVKNRKPVTSTVVGVDLTKNWNSHWGAFGGSYTASSPNYIGIGPFSEPETRQVSNYIETFGYKLSGLLSFRAFGQKILIPFAHTANPMYNYNKMIAVARRAIGSLSVKYNTQYLAGTSLAVSDGSTGTIADWAKYRFNPPVVSTFLLRDQGSYGYALPVNQVEPTCEETYDAVIAMLREAKFINIL